MLSLYLKGKEIPEKNVSPAYLNSNAREDFIWIDLDAPTPSEREEVEKFIGMKLLTRAQASEIESTSKYSETTDTVIANCNYFLSQGHSYQIEPTSFIITKEGVLVTEHQVHPSSFGDIQKKIEADPEKNSNGYQVFLTILEALIDYDADMVELINKQIASLSKDINTTDNINKEVLHRINSLQEKTMTMRENIFDLQRVLSGIMKSSKFPQGSEGRVTLMLKDVDSLISHGELSFERLDYLQDTALGLINIEQNEIVKILSVAAVIFMPPTLIASIYGMNFKIMPELDWVWTLSNGWVVPAGYLFALCLMLMVTLLTYWFFRYKKWL